MLQPVEEASLESPPVDAYSFGPYRFDPAIGILSRDGEERHLPPRASAVLETLLAQAGDVVSKDELVTAVWGDTCVTDQSPAEAVRVVRDALGDDPHEPRYIQTVHRRGYRFIADLDRCPRPIGAGAAEPGSETPSGGLQRWRRRRARFVWMSMGILLGAIGVGAVTQLGATADPPTSGLRLRIALEHPLIPSNPPSLALSPDGTTLAYRAQVDGEQHIFLQRLDGFAGRVLAGSSHGSGPFFSPDGRWLGFFADRQMLKVSVFGGEPMVVADSISGPFGGATWGTDGRIVFSRGSRAALWSVPASGGEPELVADPRTETGGEYAYLWPHLCDDGSLLFSIQPVGAIAGRDVRIGLLRPGRTKFETLLDNGGTHPRRLVNERLAFVRAGALFAAPLDGSRWRTRVTAEPILDDLLMVGPAAQLALARDGVIAYARGADPTRRLAWASAEGELEFLALSPGLYGRHDLAPDQRSVALSIDGDIWLHDLERSSSIRLTNDTADEITPIWSPDGTRVVFGSNRYGPYDLFVQDTRSGEPEATLLRGPHSKIPLEWTGGGTRLLYGEIHPDTGADLWIYDPEDEGGPMPLLRSRFYESQGTVSPDGRWLAYVSDELGVHEVIVRELDTPGPAYRMSHGGGRQPAWSPTGDALYFSEREEIKRVRIEPGDPVRFGKPEAVVAIPNATSFFAVGSEAERFLVGVSQSPYHPRTLQLITDGDALIASRVPPR